MPLDPYDSEFERLRQNVLPENEPYSAEREERSKAEFPYLSMTPEEYAARKASVIWVFSDHRYKYRDERLKQWLQRVFDILRDRKKVAEARQQYLTPEEVAYEEWADENSL